MVEGFVSGKSLYPEEWQDFVASTHADIELNLCRKRCADFTVQLEPSNAQDPNVLAEIKGSSMTFGRPPLPIKPPW